MFIVKAVLILLIMLALIMTYKNTTRESFRSNKDKKKNEIPRANDLIDFTNDDFTKSMPLFFGNFETTFPKAKVTEKGVITQGSFSSGDEQPEFKFQLTGPGKGFKKETFVETFDISTNKRADFVIGGLQIAALPVIPGPIIAPENKIPVKMTAGSLQFNADFWKARLVDAAGTETFGGNEFKYIYVFPDEDKKPSWSVNPTMFMAKKDLCVIKVYFRKRSGEDTDRYDYLVRMWFNTFEQDKFLENTGRFSKWANAKTYGESFTWSNIWDTRTYDEYVALNIDFTSISDGVSFKETYKRDGWAYVMSSHKVYVYPNKTDVIVPNWDGRIAFSHWRGKHKGAVIKVGIAPQNNENFPFTTNENSEPMDDVIEPNLEEHGLTFVKNEGYMEKINLFEQNTNDFALQLHYDGDEPVIEAFINGVKLGEFIISKRVPFTFYHIGHVNLTARKMNKPYGNVYFENIAIRKLSIYTNEALTESDLQSIHYENMTDAERLEACEDNVKELKYNHKVDLMIEDAKLDTVKGHRNDIQKNRISEKKVEEDELESSEYNTHRRARHYHKKFKYYETINKVLIAILCFLILIALVGLAYKSEKIRNFFQDKYERVGNMNLPKLRGQERPSFRSATNWGR